MYLSFCYQEEPGSLRCAFGILEAVQAVSSQSQLQSKNPLSIIHTKMFNLTIAAVS